MSDAVLAQEALAAAPAPWRQVLHKLSRNGTTLVSAAFLLVVVLLAIFGQLLSPYDVAAQDITARLEPPSAAHWLGTDEYGRDLLVRIMVGGQVSLAVGLSGVLVVIVVGSLVGLASGYSKRWDGPLMRLVDLMMSVPEMMLLLLLVALFGNGTWKISIFIGVTSWMATARLVRGQVLALRSSEFVEASEGMGAGPGWIARKHLARNVVDVVIVQATLSISLIILLESGLSYLGLGVQPPTPSWGNILSAGKDHLRDAWWIATFPGLAIFFTVMAFNFIGDGIRDALDVRL